MISRAEVVRIARQWIGTPWHHQGRSQGLACDCAGLLIGVARELGLADVEITGYGRLPSGHALEAYSAEYMTRIPVDTIQPGDALMFRFGGYPQHLAIVADYFGGELSIIHAYAPARKVVEHRLDGAWRAKIVAAYRLPGIA